MMLLIRRSRDPQKRLSRSARTHHRILVCEAELPKDLNPRVAPDMAYRLSRAG